MAGLLPSPLEHPWECRLASSSILLQNSPTSAAETVKPDKAPPHYENSSISNASSRAAQNEMKSGKAEAGLRKFKDYDYSVQCEGKSSRSVDPCRLHLQNKRLQRIIAFSKQRKLSADTSELSTATPSGIATQMLPNQDAIVNPPTYEIPTNALMGSLR